MRNDYQRVHEKDYGEPALFEGLWGLIRLVFGLIQFLLILIFGASDREKPVPRRVHKAHAPGPRDWSPRES